MHQVERFALRKPFCDVDHDDIGETVEQQQLGGCGANLTGAHHRDLGKMHRTPLSRACDKRAFHRRAPDRILARRQGRKAALRRVRDPR